MKHILSCTFLCFFSFSVFAQMPHDAIYMPKKSLCTALNYSNSTWSEYWEGSLLLNNQNIGKNVTQSVSIMPVYGITERLNVLAMLPYITTHNTSGNLLGQKGMQDLSLWLKYKIFEKSGFSVHGVLGGSMPISNYVPDFMPMSIGLQAKTAMARLLLNYKHHSGLYATTHATYTLRSNITIDRDAYQVFEKVINSNEVAVPNATDAALRIGYLKPKFQAEVFLNRFTCTSGDNIRRNDMPFPTNNMRATSVGLYGKFQPKKLGAIAQVSQVIDGLNMGKALSFSVGVIYQCSFAKKEAAVSK